MKKAKKVFKSFCPPIFFKVIKKVTKVSNNKKVNDEKESVTLDSSKQDLDLYWDEKYAEVLENWGADNTWNEIQLILSSCKGKVLDIACGTGITMLLLDKFKELDVYGFDISDLLIEKALEKGLSKDKLRVADATKTNYQDNEFDYSFSIGSLEHFTIEGIDKFISESQRITKNVSYHMIPVSRSGDNEGWMKTRQSFYNNSEEWWSKKFKKHFQEVYSIPSKWEDNISFGRWFICINKI